MKKILSISMLILMIFLFFPASNIKTFDDVNKSFYVKNHIIIKLRKNDVNPASLPQSTDLTNKISSIMQVIGVIAQNIKPLFPKCKNINTRLYDKYELDCFFTAVFNDKRDVNEICSLCEKNTLVEFAEPDFIGEAAGYKSTEPKLSQKPNDEFFDRQWGLYNDGSTRTTTGKNGKPGADMNVLKGWDIEKGSEDVVVGILDSGVKLDHPDLNGRIWVNKNKNDNGFINDINGWNFAYSNSDVRDDGGHGSNIAGTIGAATNNSIGYAGIDQKCKLMICKNLDEENLGEYSWWSESLYYAANNGAKVINMSEGGFDYSKTLNSAVNYAYDSGCLIIASMMNKNNNDDYYPASLPNVMAIGATDTDDGRCRQFTWGGGSNWGKHIAVVAPGNRVYGLDFKDNYNYDIYWSGTSQATAYVTGIAALLLAQDPSRTNKQLREIICSTASDQVGDPREDEPGWDEYYGWGRANLYDALNYDKSPAQKREIKDNNQDENSNSNKQQKSGDKNERAKSVDRNSSKNNNDSNDGDSKRARKGEH